MLLRVQAYDLIVNYKPGKYLYIADTLSRVSLKCNIINNEIDNEIEIHVDLLLSNLPISKSTIT